MCIHVYEYIKVSNELLSTIAHMLVWHILKKVQAVCFLEGLQEGLGNLVPKKRQQTAMILSCSCELPSVLWA